MKKLVTTVFFFVLVFTALSFGQNWSYQGAFPDTSFKTNTGVQFTAVDPDGKIWIAAYSTAAPLDTIYVPDSSKYKSVRRLYVFNPDGTPWDTIRSATVGGVLYPFYSTGYGIIAAKDGNILYNNASVMFKIDYKTGQGIARVAPNLGSLACPGVDANGNVFVTPVLPNHPIQIYNANLDFVQNALDTIDQYGRWMTVSADGNTMYVPRYSENKLRIYHRADEFAAFTLQDTILSGIACESGAWDPKVSTNLWLSTGNQAYNAPFGAFEGTEGTWYEFNTTNWQIVDSIKWQYTGVEPADKGNERSRGITFSNDGNTVYLSVFGGSNYTPVQKFTRSGVDVKNYGTELPTAYGMEQNYPNPFNPETNIRFSVPQESFVTVKVFNTLGQEVMTLVNEQKTAGTYNVSFKAYQLSSGIYFYTITANSFTSTKKMILMK